jgi:zinc transport system substrate-binding protein
LKLFFTLALLVASLAHHQSPRAEPEPTVVTSIHPLSLMVADLAGDWLEVRQLLGSNQEPHHVALSFSQRRLLADARLVVWVGPVLETYLVKSTADLEAARQLSLQALAETLEIDTRDPHLWLQPQLVAAFYPLLAEHMVAAFPQREAEIKARLEERLAAVERTTLRVKQRMAALPHRGVIVDHQAYDHFATYFGITVAGALVNETGVGGGARSFAKLAAMDNIACVVVEQLPAPQRARKLAASLGVEIVAIDPLGVSLAHSQGYPGLLEALAGGFEACLGKS